MKFKIKYKEFILSEPESEIINTPSKVLDCLKDDFNAISEELYLIIMNTKNNILEKHLIAKGDINSLAIKPADIFRLIFMTSGSRFIIAHNHPSGDVKPSEEDLTFYKKIVKLSKDMGLDFLDNIIYSDRDIYSFRKHDLI